MEKRFIDFHLEVMDSGNCSMDCINHPTTRVVFTPYSSTETEFVEFKRTCKSRGFTIGVALCGTFAFAMARCIFAKNKNKDDLPETINLVLEVPMNLRDRVTKEVPWKCASFMPSSPCVSISVSRRSTLWDVVRNVKVSFDRLLDEENKLYLFSPGLISQLSNGDSKQRIETAKQKMGGFSKHGCFSNMKT